jgi:hypothetical protein
MCATIDVMNAQEKVRERPGSGAEVEGQLQSMPMGATTCSRVSSMASLLGRAVAT